MSIEENIDAYIFIIIYIITISILLRSQVVVLSTDLVPKFLNLIITEVDFNVFLDMNLNVMGYN